jgi:hypothetical protein
MSLDAEAAQQLHHVMIMFWRRITDTEYPVKQIGVGAIEQCLEPPELVAVQGLERVLSERSENEVAFLRPAVPAAKQEAPAADVGMFAICWQGKDILHLETAPFTLSCDALQCCILMLIGALDGIIMFAFISAMIHIVPATTTNTMSKPKASASTLFVLSGPLVTCRKNTR